MKKCMLFITGMLLWPVIEMSAQEFSMKFGKISQDELAMDIYPADSSANAIYVFQKCEMNYIYKNGFSLNYEIEVKVKVLKEEGLKYADVTIPFYKNEDIINITATTYNLEKGKTVKTKMDRKYIFEEKINKNVSHKKFSIPAVKAGSVFEYKYTLKSTDFKPRTWMMQQEIPVKSSELVFVFPEYFIFNIETRGSQRATHEQQKTSVTYHISSNSGPTETLRCEAFYNTFSAMDLPAVKTDESHLWCPSDYQTQLSFELQATNFPGRGYKPIISTWEQIDKILIEDSEFGSYLNMKNPYSEEIKKLDLKDKSLQEKVLLVFDVVKSKITWDKKYRITSESVKNAAKAGIGSNAEINFILMAALRDAGIASAPVVMSSRDHGLLPFGMPTISNLNTFILCISDEEKVYYIDGSMDEGWFNALPPNLRTDRGRVLKISDKIKEDALLADFIWMNRAVPEQWVDLRTISNPTSVCQIKATLSPEGKISGECITYLSDIFGQQRKRSYREAKDTLDYIEKIEKELNLKVSKYQQKPEKERLRETFSFEKEPDMTADRMIYINPLIFAHISNNQFKQAERKLPIEFGCTSLYRKIVTILLPQGYEVEELPESVKIGTETGGCECSYYLGKQSGVIQLNYTYRINQIFFGAEEYENLKNFFGAIATKNKEMIVLRKTQL